MSDQRICEATPCATGFESIITIVSPLLSELRFPNSKDDVSYCGPNVLKWLKDDPQKALEYADNKLRTTWPFKDVEIEWRMLYEDASLLIAIETIVRELRLVNQNRRNSQRPADGEARSTRGDDNKNLGGHNDSERVLEKRSFDQTPDELPWLTEVVRLLDMAIIMAGTPRRRITITELFKHLEACFNNGVLSSNSEAPPPSKRQRRSSPGSTISSDQEFKTDSSCYRAPEIQNPPQTFAPSEVNENLIKEPFVLKHGIDHWPALTTPERRWANPKYLLDRTFHGGRLVPVEIGRSYTDEGWGQKIMSFGKFMDRWILEKESSKEEQVGYLAQYDLLHHIPSLRSDISVPDIVWHLMGSESHEHEDTDDDNDSIEPTRKSTHMTEPIINSWFGPAGTITPLHTDPYDNILCQVVGKKYIRLYPPKETPRMFPRGKEKQGNNGNQGDEDREVDMSNTSSIPVDVVEMGAAAISTDQEDETAESKYEEFEKAKYFDVVLSEGEALYIPRGWWHYVRSLTVSFSVSFWWD